MKSFNKVILDGRNRKVFFNGSCLGVVKLCEAMCCRQWNVNLDNNEFKSGLYKADVFCKLNKDNCKNKNISCMNRGYQLKRKKDNSCIYLSSNNKCQIYQKRPKVCVDFSCKAGWMLSSVAAQTVNKDDLKNTQSKSDAGKFLRENLKFDMFFIINPLIELKGVFYLKEKNELVFLKKVIYGCNLSSFNAKFNNPVLNDNSLFYVIKLFNGRNDLKSIYRSANNKYSLGLSKKCFLKIVELLFLHQIIIFKYTK